MNGFMNRFVDIIEHTHCITWMGYLPFFMAATVLRLIIMSLHRYLLCVECSMSGGQSKQYDSPTVMVQPSLSLLLAVKRDRCCVTIVMVTVKPV